MPYTDIRVRHVRNGLGRPGGDYVLYWMQVYRRLESNHALDEALRRADEAGKPLVVYEGLRLDYPWARVRHHCFLDGRDPNSRSGILWCFGLFDRPWAPERQVLGRIRYMSSASTARKFRLGPYLAYVDSLPKPA